MLCTPYVSSKTMHSEYFIVFQPVFVLPSSNDTILSVSAVLHAVSLLIISKLKDKTAEVSMW